MTTLTELITYKNAAKYEIFKSLIRFKTNEHCNLISYLLQIILTK